jgi:signal transduction histidine kinase
MQRNTRPPASRLNLQRKLTLAHGVVSLAAVLFAEGMALGAVAAITRQPIFTRSVWSLHVALATVGAAAAGLLLGAWASRRVTRRVDRTLKVSQMWLRGNLSLRIADPLADDLGLLAEQLDSLAGHLEQDEQDLDELRERNMRLSDQVRALAVVEERNRLARELHDSVKQHLFSLAMTTGAIRARFDALPDAPSELVEMAREIETTAQIAQRETTRLIEDLRPGTLQEQGLAAALNDYTLLCGAREHILIYLDVQGNDKVLPPSLAEALYRVAQEALHNVARHAQATRVDVHLRCLPMQVTLTAHDNGIGFDTSQPRRGLGLANMQERMLTVGGRLSIESRPGSGTTVMAEVALPHPWPTDAACDARPEIYRQDRRRPSPTIENWAWLGQRLVIPVGQTWPWLPADQMHLRRPLIEPGQKPLAIQTKAGFLGLKRGYVLHVLRVSEQDQHRLPLARVSRSHSGYEWKAEGASWALRRVQSPSGRMVLTRNGQPLAAMQYRGRLLDTWSEIIYDGRGYRLCHIKGEDGADGCVLADESGDEYLSVEGGRAPQVELRRPLPLPLLVMAAMRVLDEAVPNTAAMEAVPATN